MDFLTNFLTVTENTQQPSYLFIYIMYGALFLYFLYKMYKGYTESKKVMGEKYYFRKTNITYIKVTVPIILFFAAFNFYTKMYFIALLMVGLVVLLIMDSRVSTIVAENGIFAGGTFVEWNNIKKWGYDSKRSEIVISYKIGYSQRNTYAKILPENIEEVNNLIKKFKQKN